MGINHVLKGIVQLFTTKCFKINLMGRAKQPYLSKSLKLKASDWIQKQLLVAFLLLRQAHNARHYLFYAAHSWKGDTAQKKCLCSFLAS